ncbi:MAG: DnaJ domain-containing protein [Lachnospiraceae bacterium]|nr:DnaJ domain-containing protein [Lachnospiraceae bacterium]
MFFNPYQVLGVSETASDDEIKKAYRELSRRYHPDANINNPNKDKAEEQFKQVQQAYDEIMKIRSSRGSGGGSSYGYGQQNSYGYGRQNGYGYGRQNGYGYRERDNYGGAFYQNPFGSFYERRQTRQEMPLEFQAAANYINAGHYQEGLNVLNRMESGFRNALWYYLRGMANAGLGNQMNALEDARMASSLEPNNMQYRSFLQSLESGGGFYNSMGRGYGRNDIMDSNFLCPTLCMMSLCCPCNGPC